MVSKLVHVLVLVLLSVTLCAEDVSSDHVIQFYQWRAARDPDNYATFDRLGSAYSQKARETGDPTYYELSEKAYNRALSLLPPAAPGTAGTSAHLAALYLSEHRFSEAEALAKKALTLEPNLASVYAVLGDAELESGQYEQASASYAKLQEPARSFPPKPGLAYLAETRQASISFIRGKSQQAIEHMQTALQPAQEARLPNENIAWIQFSLGELYFGVGDFTRADECYQAALKSYPNYHRALAWLGQLRAVQGKYAEGVVLYRKAIAVIPLPIYVAALGDIETRLGNAAEARKSYALVNVIARLSTFNQTLFRRELATFYADHNMHFDEAVRLAQAELKVRQDVFTWDVMAWTLYKDGRGPEAAAAVEHALAMGTQDALIFFHAGAIYQSLGDRSKATDFLERALALNPHFHIFYAAAAKQSLAQLKGEPANGN